MVNDLFIVTLGLRIKEILGMNDEKSPPVTLEGSEREE